MKHMQKITSIILIIITIVETILLINFYRIPNRIVNNSINNQLVLQTEEDCYYEIIPSNNPSSNLFNRISNIYSIKAPTKSKAYYYNQSNLPIFTYDNLGKIELKKNEYLYYITSTENRLSFFSKMNFELPEIKYENIEKIVLKHNDEVINEIHEPDNIELFLKNINVKFNELDEELSGVYNCYFYYKHTYIYEDITDDYLQLNIIN